MVRASVPPRASTSTRSTPSVSMRMFPGWRRNRSRGPLGDMAKVSAPCGAVEVHRVVAPLALDDVAAVARVPDERVVAGAHEGDVVAAVAVDDVVAGAAEEELVPAAAEQRVVAAVSADVVISVSVKVPLASSIRTVSSPRPARTAIRSNVARSKVASAVPSSPKSTWTRVGTPVSSRSAMRSAPRSPETISVPPATWAVPAAAAPVAPIPAPASRAPAASRPARERRRMSGRMVIGDHGRSSRCGVPAAEDAARRPSIPGGAIRVCRSRPWGRT